MTLKLPQSAIRIFLIASLAVASLSVLVDEGQAQVLKELQQIRADFESSNQFQYAPNDPLTRSRLFNLQTGHFGAFYNCDGEESKRNSPYICWKNASGHRWHRTFSDVLNWRRDKTEIAQRICDGGCCASKTAKQPCGCSTCASGGRTATLFSQAAQTPAHDLAKKKVRLAPYSGVAGLLEVESNQDQTLRMATTSKAGSVTEQNEVCDCLACRAKRSGHKKVETLATTNTEPAATSVIETPVATSRTASLLDRARSSRKR